MAIFSLSVHADYRCRQSGACCTTQWDVPVEPAAHEVIAQALVTGALSTDSMPFVIEPGLPSSASAMLQRDAAGACLFLEGAGLCSVHRVLGEGALPSACRLFPRIALTDARGTFITLSHYCPTAARALLRDDVPLGVVEAPPAFPPADYEGLAAEDAWPPTLRPGVLMGLDGFAAWERHAVELFGTPGVSPEAAMATLARDAEILRKWSPGASSILAAMSKLPRPLTDVPPPSRLSESLAIYRGVAGAVPFDLHRVSPPGGTVDAWQRLVLPSWSRFNRAASAYLASHAFGNWCAYQGPGLRTWVRSVEAALAVLSVECAWQCLIDGGTLDRDLFVAGVRASDLLLRHHASREDLADRWSRLEATSLGV